ncbi:MAG TPA: AbrB/MazE/SpoVT family DNA-binding domain-containing protein [bacterium]|nr:AbrB/MazE/SpoVT family DNA-binding domain-containing protein [bacterium]
MGNTSTVTVRGQTAIPVALRRRYNIRPGSRIVWIDDGSVITVLPQPAAPVGELRGSLRQYDLNRRLLQRRRRERQE